LLAGLALVAFAVQLAERYSGKGTEVVAFLVAGLYLVTIGAYHVSRADVSLVKGSLGMSTSPETANYAQDAASGEPTTATPASPVQPKQVEDAARYYIADRVLPVLLDPNDGPLAGSKLNLYIYDEESERLTSVLEADDKGYDEWAPGHGAVGTAWRDRSYIIATGKAVSDETFGLTTEQQERYAALKAVAAAPVLNAARVRIAVVSAATADLKAAEELASEDGQAALVALASGIARILVDLLNWYTDGADG
jgi:hypothetical protein